MNAGANIHTGIKDESLVVRCQRARQRAVNSAPARHWKGAQQFDLRLIRKNEMDSQAAQILVCRLVPARRAGGTPCRSGRNSKEQLCGARRRRSEHSCPRVRAASRLQLAKGDLTSSNLKFPFFPPCCFLWWRVCAITCVPAGATRANLPLVPQLPPNWQISSLGTVTSFHLGCLCLALFTLARWGGSRRKCCNGAHANPPMPSRPVVDKGSVRNK